MLAAFAALALASLAALAAPGTLHVQDAPARAPHGEASTRLPVQRAGLVVLRGSERAPLPAELDALGRVRIVLGEARAPEDLALAAHDWIADAPSTVDRLSRAQAFEFAGGSPYRLLEALYPKKSESRAIQVLRERHRLGVPVIGTGAGAGFVSALTFAAVAERERRERNPRRTDAIASLWSLSILPWAMVATEVETAGDLEPFVAALIERHARCAIFLAPEATLSVDLQRGETIALGRGGVWILDLKRARRDRTGFGDARLHWLQAGDRWEVRTRRATLGAGAELAPERAPEEALEVVRALSSESLGRGLGRYFEAPLPRVWRVVGPDAEWTLTIDADTRLVGRSAGVLAIAGLRLDLRLAPGHTRP